MQNTPTQIDLQGRRAPTAIWQPLVLVISLLVCFWGAIAWPASFWPAGLITIAFWTSISLGCLGIGLLHQLTGGLWGWGISRDLSAAMSTIPLTGLFVLPLCFAARWVFPWAYSLRELNPHQQIYLAPTFVLTRTLVEWGLWSGLALWYLKGYRQTVRDPAIRCSAGLAAFGLIVLWLSVTSASIDGLMSLDPTNNSSMFGAIEAVGCVVAALAWILLLRSRSAGAGEHEEQISHDLGNLLFAFNFIWLYLAFSQYIIVWAADLPHETKWHLARQRGTAGIIGIVLLVIHFAVPFGLLLSANLKRHAGRLAVVAGILLAARLTAFCWTVLPACPGVDWRAAIGVVATFCLLGSFWIAVYGSSKSRLPTIDPIHVSAAREDSSGASVEMTT